MSKRAKLIVLSEQHRGKIFTLDKEIVTVGRGDQTDICIEDPTISAYHCDFIHRNGTYVLRDNTSTNGSKVNNVPVSEQLLKSSDIVQLGKIEILFDNEGESGSVARSNTGIKFESVDRTEFGLNAVKKLNNLSPFQPPEPAKVSFSKIILAISLALALVLVALIGWVIWAGMTNNSEEETSASGSQHSGDLHALATKDDNEHN